jgi:hypothetical protein
VISVIALALIAAAAVLIALVAFVVVVFAIHATERQYTLRHRRLGRIDKFTRRLLGVYTDPPRLESNSPKYEYTRR